MPEFKAIPDPILDQLRVCDCPPVVKESGFIPQRGQYRIDREALEAVAHCVGLWKASSPWWNQTIDWLDRYYPNWRGYRVD